MPKENIDILLIDDNKDECNFFKEALQYTNIPFQLTCCPDAMDDVYFQLSQKSFHVIFLDIRMPGDNGIKFLEKIKEKEIYKHIPVIMYTVSANEKDIDRCYALGAFHYVVKPYSLLNLVETLRKIFKTDFSKPQSNPSPEKFVINLAFA